MFGRRPYQPLDFENYYEFTKKFIFTNLMIKLFFDSTTGLQWQNVQHETNTGSSIQSVTTLSSKFNFVENLMFCFQSWIYMAIDYYFVATKPLTPFIH